MLGGLKECQEKVRAVSGQLNKREVTTVAFFTALLSEQLGQVSHKYMDEGDREALKDGVDIADLVVCSLAFMNWLNVDADEAFEKALKKHANKLMVPCTECGELIPVRGCVTCPRCGLRVCSG